MIVPAIFNRSYMGLFDDPIPRITGLSPIELEIYEAGEYNAKRHSATTGREVKCIPYRDTAGKFGVTYHWRDRKGDWKIMGVASAFLWTPGHYEAAKNRHEQDFPNG